jgi:hypothetical protein
MWKDVYDRGNGTSHLGRTETWAKKEMKEGINWQNSENKALIDQFSHKVDSLFTNIMIVCIISYSFL